MIHLIIGPSCAGKTSLTVNTFIKGQEIREYKDLIPVSECGNIYLIGKYIDDNHGRTKGTDRISRKDIPKIAAQVLKLNRSGKDVVLEGDKICSRNLFEELRAAGAECQLWWVRCSKETSIKRNRQNNSSCSDSYLKAVATKAENLFWEWHVTFNGGIIDTEAIEDLSRLSLETVVPIFPHRKTINAGKEFAVFILTHGRADNVVTMGALRKAGYSGKWYMIIDDEDDQRAEYEKNFGTDNVIVFDKQAAYDRADTMDNFGEHRAIVYARNECWRIAKNLGLKYFLMLDDDYTAFQYRYRDGTKLAKKSIENIDEIFEKMLRFLDVSGALSVAFTQGGDLIGGLNGNRFRKGVIRKAMNSFFCRVDRPIEFRGTMNEDVVTYTTLGSTGNLFFTYMPIMVNQLETQSLSGGMTEVYRTGGTYVKSFYAVMAMPSAVKIGMLHTSHSRVHHYVSWENTVPKIISEKWKKGRSAD